MKKETMAILIILVVWNIILTTVLMNFKKDADISQGQTTTVKQLSTEFETDYTKVIDLCKDMVVGVSSSSALTTNVGSGVVYGHQEDGGVLIVTNHHLINNSGEITVTFANNISLSAQLLGKDAYSDIALLLVYPRFHIDAFTLGDSSAVNAGEWILTIGNSAGVNYYGYYNSGILSSKARTVRKDLNGDGTPDFDFPLLQTDNQLNSDNTGGALINMAGELIGIISDKISLTSNDAGFALPINEVVLIVNQLLASGTVTRPILGISAKDLTEVPLYLKSYYQVDLSVENGVLITGIIKDTPAEAAGLLVGDVIIGINEVKLTGYKQYRSWLYQLTGEETITLSLRRNEETLTVHVPLP